ncbi:MAG: type II toxin-antitoxin system Phd/YefM family antitoxin [Chloroflexi bacterium]|nr:type II toxin-antitoxin system Phd/YefM family antitoxin [Chloroflexota bacterium]
MSAILPIIPVSDLRSNTKQTLALVKDEPVVLTQRGRATAVLLNIDAYNEMVQRLQRLEDFRDEAVALLAQARMDSLEFVGPDALADLYQEKLEEDLPFALPV